MLLAVLGACAGDDDKALPKCADGRNAVTLEIGGPADHAAYRDGDGDWEDAIALDDAHVQVCANDDFMLFMTCTDAVDHRHITRQYAAIAADGDQQFARVCASAPPPAPKTVLVRFSATADGNIVFRPVLDLVPVHVDEYETGAELPVGDYDIVASSDPVFPGSLPSSLFVRTIRADRDDMATMIDFSQEEPVAHRSLAIAGLVPSEQVSVSVSWHLPAGGLFTFPATSTSVWSASPPLLAHGGEQWLDVSGAQREVTIKYDGQTDVELPARLEDIQVDEVGAAWSKLPAYDRAQFMRYTTDAEVFAIATKAWMDRHHARSLALDTTAPGYDALWADAANPVWDRYFQVSREEDDRITSVWTWDRANGP